MLSRRAKSLVKAVIPNEYHGTVHELKERVSGYGYRTYSQQGEDIILRWLFHGVMDGFYVDVGAHHPKRYSNTYHFYKMGWRGINIDAMPGSMRAFARVRPRDINLEVGVSRTGGFLRYYAFNEPGLNGFYQEDSVEKVCEGERHVMFTKDIETLPLSKILDRHLPDGQSINFFSVDVEGLDAEVLESNDWSSHSPPVVLTEALDSSSMEEVRTSAVYKLLTSRGYFLFSKCIHTLIFVKEGFFSV